MDRLSSIRPPRSAAKRHIFQARVISSPGCRGNAELQQQAELVMADQPVDEWHVSPHRPAGRGCKFSLADELFLATSQNGAGIAESRKAVC